MNKLSKVINDDGLTVFFYTFDGEYFYWIVDTEIVNRYFDVDNGTMTEEQANIFLNDEDNTNIGCGVGSFETLEDAESDYNENK